MLFDSRKSIVFIRTKNNKFKELDKFGGLPMTNEEFQKVMIEKFAENDKFQKVVISELKGIKGELKK